MPVNVAVWISHLSEVATLQTDQCGSWLRKLWVPQSWVWISTLKETPSACSWRCFYVPNFEHKNIFKNRRKILIGQKWRKKKKRQQAWLRISERCLKSFPAAFGRCAPILQRHCSSLPHRHPGPPSSLVPACQLGGSRHRAWLVYKARTGEKNLIFFWFSTERRAAVRSSYVTRWRPWFVFFCFDLFFRIFEPKPKLTTKKISSEKNVSDVDLNFFNE